MPRSVSLAGNLDAFVDAQIDSGRFRNDREVIEAGLRLLEAREQSRLAKLAELRHSIEASRGDGRLLTEAEVFDPLEAEYATPVQQVERPDQR